MFEKNAALFLYCVSPVHMGAGTGTGVIDSPIQREVHSGQPSFAGSGLKGAVRHGFEALGGNAADIDRLFGPESRSGDLHAGAVSFGDAQLMLFPVRSRRQGYVYATSPGALGRARRLLTLAGVAVDWTVPEVAEGHCLTTEAGHEGLVAESDRLHLEVFEYQARSDAGLDAIGAWLATNGLTGAAAAEHFAQKMARDLVVLSDTDLAYYSHNATLVEPHVRIDPETGTADGRGLFYIENLPPEALMVAPLMASAEHTKQRELDAEAVLGRMRTVLDGQLLQIGGNATTGRGLVAAGVVEGG